MIDWIFRNRRTGGVTIVQRPNVPLAVFLVATVVRWIIQPSGGAATALSVVATGALAVWAIDEVIRGVNPWRRMLGGGMLVWLLVRLVAR